MVLLCFAIATSYGPHKLYCIFCIRWWAWDTRIKNYIMSYWQKLWKTNSFIKATGLLWGLYLAHFLHCVADSNNQFIGSVRKFCHRSLIRHMPRNVWFLLRCSSKEDMWHSCEFFFSRWFISRCVMCWFYLCEWKNYVEGESSAR